MGGDLEGVEATVMILTIWNRSSFRVGVYRWYWAANVLVHITYLLQAVALGWHMLEVTGSPFQVGLVAFAYGLPLLVVAPFSGLVADRMKRQWVVQAAMAVAVLTSAALALLVKSGATEPIAFLIASSMLAGPLPFTRRHAWPCCRTWCRRQWSSTRLR